MSSTSASWMGAASEPVKSRAATPVILDTDIGDDIDDTWALGLLLKCPELDVKLVVGDFGKPAYRAKILAKFLQTAGRTDIPVGLGLRQMPDAVGPQAEWVKDYELSAYPGQVHEDGVQAIIDTIRGSEKPVTVIAICPLPNLAAALERAPDIAQKARFVGMYGSVRRGYGGDPDISLEWNVLADVKACEKVFTASWEVTITPLDTCGLVTLDGDRYARVRDCPEAVPAAIMANYRIWSQHRHKDNDMAEHFSSTLYDTVAVYLAIRQDFCRMERLGIRISDDGYTLVDEQAKPINVATEWKNLDGFRDWLVQRLTAS